MMKISGIFLLFSLGMFSITQGQDLLKNDSQSFVMNCYQKKYSSDTLNIRRNFDYIKDYRRCLSCRLEFENSKIVQKVFNAQLTNEVLPLYNSKWGADYYGYYRSVISRKRYSRILRNITG